MLFGRREKSSYSVGNGALLIDASRLKNNERLDLKYDRFQNLIAVQKITVSLFDSVGEGRAETEIEPGNLGRVFYQGTYWNARNDSEVRILVG